MATWASVAAEAPDIAAAVRRRISGRRQVTMATLRSDGMPRISGVECRFVAEDVWIAGMAGARKFLDLRRDPRLTLHSGIDDPDAWTGEAKLTGTAVESLDGEQVAAYALAGPGGAPPGPFQLFRLEVSEVVVVSEVRMVGERQDHLVIESWHEGAGTSRSLRPVPRGAAAGRA